MPDQSLPSTETGDMVPFRPFMIEGCKWCEVCVLVESNSHYPESIRRTRRDGVANDSFDPVAEDDENGRILEEVKFSDRVESVAKTGSSLRRATRLGGCVCRGPKNQRKRCRFKSVQARRMTSQQQRQNPRPQERPTDDRLWPSQRGDDGWKRG